MQDCTSCILEAGAPFAMLFPGGFVSRPASNRFFPPFRVREMENVTRAVIAGRVRKSGTWFIRSRRAPDADLWPKKIIDDAYYSVHCDWKEANGWRLANIVLPRCSKSPHRCHEMVRLARAVGLQRRALGDAVKAVASLWSRSRPGPAFLIESCMRRNLSPAQMTAHCGRWVERVFRTNANYIDSFKGAEDIDLPGEAGSLLFQSRHHRAQGCRSVKALASRNSRVVQSSNGNQRGPFSILCSTSLQY